MEEMANVLHRSRGAKYDASTTNLTYRIPSPSKKHHAEPLELKLSFLSPITPASTLRQSIPAAYMTIYVNGTFDIDLYVDVNGQWVSGDRSSHIVWDLEHRGIKHTQNSHKEQDLKTFKIKRKTEQVFTEISDRAEWGELHFTAPANVRHGCGISGLLRQRFSRTGTLQNEIDENYRQIMDDEPVFAFSKSFRLGNDSKSSSSSSIHDNVTFTIAHIQDPVVQYASARGLTFMRPLWKTWFPSDEALIEYHYLDFHNALTLARNYSDQLAIDAYESGSDSYVDIVALSARQIMGATSFSGTAENPILFLKEISSNGNSQTVDVIFPAFPFFLYTSPRWLAYLLEPHIEHQLSGQYPNNYAMHDLGAHFPNMTGHADGKDEYMPVEECGDMLIMGLALVQSLATDKALGEQLLPALSSGEIKSLETEPILPLSIVMDDVEIDALDKPWNLSVDSNKRAQKWLTRSYRLYKQWTQYLVDFSLEPHNQLSTDDFAGWLALHSNLALKGIIGIKAMSELAATVGNEEDVRHYRNISETYISRWVELAMSRDKTHAKLAYDWYGSWTTLYSLFADAMLCFHPSIMNFSTSTPSSETHHTNPNAHDQQPLLGPEKQCDNNHNNSDFIPHHIYTRQSSYYNQVMQRYGLPLDSRHRYAKSDWAFMVATVASPSTRKDILTRFATWVNSTVTDKPLTDLYETEEEEGRWGGGIQFYARPVVGGHFVFLALGQACGGGGLRWPEGDDMRAMGRRDEL
ncbi:hypothetical protein LTS18_013466 [Coniosporium uncinatum]|uniref:Uncharacterized protein n=1 Tax=Coniosporium uncinatum TaxID=93489 RepID=A0ACC3D8V8_9PEZI|nr:hypothetical protein LTS18_013466 [Coniosporium uncinatum]